MFLKGSRRNLADSSQNFSFFLAALELGFLPAGPIGLYDIRRAGGRQHGAEPRFDLPRREGMALLKWHRHMTTRSVCRPNRTLADWLAQKGAFAFGWAAGSR